VFQALSTVEHVRSHAAAATDARYTDSRAIPTRTPLNTPSPQLSSSAISAGPIVGPELCRLSGVEC
jgi:hypothetical protein